MIKIKSGTPSPSNRKHESEIDLVLRQALHQLFKNRPDLLAFVLHPSKARLRRSSEILMQEARGLSSGEHLLIRIALDLWDQSEKVGLSEMIQTLDESNFDNMMKALRILRPELDSRSTQFTSSETHKSSNLARPGQKRQPKSDTVYFLMTEKNVYRTDEILKQLEVWLHAFRQGKLMPVSNADPDGLDEFEAHLERSLEKTASLPNLDVEF